MSCQVIPIITIFIIGFCFGYIVCHATQNK